MKFIVSKICSLAVFSLLTIHYQGQQPFKEVTLLKNDPVSHIKDVEYRANPRFAPPPTEITEKAFLKAPLVDFASDPLWKARLYGSEGFLCLSRDQMIRKRPNLKLELTSPKTGAMAEIIPVKPVKSSREFDCFMLLAYAKNVSVVTVKFRKPDGKIYTWQSRKNNFNELLTGWHLLRIPLYTRMPAGTELLSIGFQSIRFRTNRAPDIWHLEQFGITMTQDHLKRPPVRFNTGKVVKIPVSPAGARPVPCEKVSHRVWKEGSAFKLSYMNAKGVGAVFTYRPEKGTLADISVRCASGKEIRPAAGSGPIFTAGGKSFDIRKKGEVTTELLNCQLKNNQVQAVWKFKFGKHSQIITYRFGIAGKSLIVDLDSKERFLKEWWPGHAEGTAANAKIFAVPFMNHTPKILWNDGWFFSHFHDYYKGNFSIHSHDAGSQVLPGKAFYNFLQIGYCYSPRSDGSRHPLRETVYITAARNFEEVLINPSNPKSPYQEMLSNNLYKKFEVRSDIFRKAKVLTDLYDQYGVNHIFFDVFGWLWISGLWGSGESAFHSAQLSYIHQQHGGDKAF
ncbi:MAG: hypothetical protein IKB99_05235 [Lentisphaeria bacterium]|nr:hypothetical protein [Lentisphaeria bacterium]